MKQNSNLHRCHQKRRKMENQNPNNMWNLFLEKSLFFSNQDFQGILGSVGSWIQVNTRIFRLLPWRLVSWKHRPGIAIICLLQLLSSHQDVSPRTVTGAMQARLISLHLQNRLTVWACQGWSLLSFLFFKMYLQQFSLQSKFAEKSGYNFPWTPMMIWIYCFALY